MKVLKYKESLHVFFPENVAKEMQLKEGDELDFIELKKGRFFVVKKEELGGIVKKALGLEEGITDGEKAFLNYITTYFKPNERNPYNLRKNLSKEQLTMLNNLISKGFVALVKDEDGNMVYHINKDVFHEILTYKKEGDWDYLIVDELGAEEISKRYENDIKNGTIMGVRGFDKNFYVVRSNFYGLVAEKIKKMLKNSTKSVEQISNELKVDKNACKAVMEILLSDGEVIEPKREFFTLA